MNKKGMEMWWLITMLVGMLILLAVILILRGQGLTMFDFLGNFMENLRFR